MSPKQTGPDDYVDVAQRIQDFYAKYPEGSLTTGSPPQVHTVGPQAYVWFHARAYRTPDDPRPGDGWALEPIPGPTPFTKNSELQNAETSAWGRAIVSLGFATKHIASSQDVRNRREEAAAVQTRPAAGAGTAPAAAPPTFTAPVPDALDVPIPDDNNSPASRTKLFALLGDLDKQKPLPDATWTEAARHHILETYRADSTKQLTEAEMADVYKHFAGFRKAGAVVT